MGEREGNALPKSGRESGLWQAAAGGRALSSEPEELAPRGRRKGHQRRHSRERKAADHPGIAIRQDEPVLAGRKDDCRQRYVCPEDLHRRTVALCAPVFVPRLV